MRQRNDEIIEEQAETIIRQERIIKELSMVLLQQCGVLQAEIDSIYISECAEGQERRQNEILNSKP